MDDAEVRHNARNLHRPACSRPPMSVPSTGCLDLCGRQRKNAGRMESGTTRTLYAVLASADGLCCSLSVNLICPGFVYTPLVAKQIPEQVGGFVP